VLLDAVVFALKALLPTAVLLDAVVIASPARPPMSVFSKPVVTAAPAALTYCGVVSSSVADAKL
jgi:hypothetical protein